MSEPYHPEPYTTDATLVLPADPEHPISTDFAGDDITMSSSVKCDFETPTIDSEWLATRGPSRVEVL
jgi:hypothetical protein